MKDWQRSPEPPSMMGTAVLERRHSGDSPDRTVVDAAAILPKLTARPLGGGRDAKLSLTNMCRKVVLRNLHAVQNLGDMPFRIAKDILEQCRVDQLITIEEASPHLLTDTDQIWKRNCLRDFVEVRKKYESDAKEPKSWRRVYFRKKGELEEQKAEAKQRIKDRYASHRAEKDAKKLVVSDRPLMKTRGTRRPGGGFATTTTPGTKGHSLIMKARSGSLAAARLTGGGKNAFRPTTVGRARAAGSQLQSSSPVAQRPMVAPKRVSGQSQRLKEAIEWNQKAVASDSEDANDEDRLGDTRATKRARIEPPRQAAATAPDASVLGRPSARSTAAASAAISSSPASSSSGSSSSTTTTTTTTIGKRRTIDFFGSSSRSSTSSPVKTSSSSVTAAVGTTTKASSIDSPSRGTKRPSPAVTVTTSKKARLAQPSAPTSSAGGASGDSSSDDASVRRLATRPSLGPRTDSSIAGAKRSATHDSSSSNSSSPLHSPPIGATTAKRQRLQGGRPPAIPPPAPVVRRTLPSTSTSTSRLPSSSSSSALPMVSAAAMSSIFMPRNRFTSQRPRS
ncbi:uncharacterized protein PFL1_01366 [Pseudozyma flocculosa PF-1]|uniref:Elongin-A n=1 Tax=Pseudozyma flocculosa TaxID=84751 RepID=A0A5C3EVQ6_9BASI|nr:uncharacterized protein PFL1_01366 [Pseudozyma flocculosa PF-1]EPQ31178.1 hypothetical protein PFL1_01366 [Pseudozyma flocculosa PF-1]SPO36328.1 uncharacterized protein PSFLO_01799 [Pseudozyma flocculosa]